MKTKYIYLLILLMSFYGLCAQGPSYNIKIDYAMQTNFSVTSNFIGTLYCNSDHALYTYQDQRRENVEDFDSDQLKIISIKADTACYFIQTDSMVNSLRSKIDGKGFWIVTEERPDIKWEIHSEFRNMDGYECVKATCHFRGRDYEAWYAPEIPIKFGPYKFHGLPGVIFTLKDSKEEVIFNLTKISFTDGLMPKINTELPHISREEYQQQLNESFEKIKRAITSRASRNIKVSIDSFEVQTIELE